MLIMLIVLGAVAGELLLAVAIGTLLAGRSAAGALHFEHATMSDVLAAAPLPTATPTTVTTPLGAAAPV